MFSKQIDQGNTPAPMKTDLDLLKRISSVYKWKPTLTFNWCFPEILIWKPGDAESDVPAMLMKGESPSPALLWKWQLSCVTYLPLFDLSLKLTEEKTKPNTENNKQT